MSRLPIEARDDERERVEALAAELADGRDPNRVEVALRQAVEQSHRRVQRRQAELARAATLRQQLAPYLDQQRAADLDEQLASVVEDGRSLSFELERDAVAAADACARETDRRLAASAAADAFRELGYDVEEGFESLAVEHGAAHVTRPGWEGYAIRWRLQDRRMRFQVVGAADRGWTTGGNEVRDREVQAAFCDELLRVQEQFGAHGIGFTVDEAVEPGQRPVEQVEQLPFRQYRRRASEAPRAKRRQR